MNDKEITDDLSKEIYLYALSTDISYAFSVVFADLNILLAATEFDEEETKNKISDILFKLQNNLVEYHPANKDDFEEGNQEDIYNLIFDLAENTDTISTIGSLLFVMRVIATHYKETRSNIFTKKKYTKIEKLLEDILVEFSDIFSDNIYYGTTEDYNP